MRKLVVLLMLVWVMGCAGDEGSLENSLDITTDPEYGKPLLGVDEQRWKEDSANGSSGPAISADTSSTAVWEVTNNWSDRNTPAAVKAGIAWGENSGLTWDEKYTVWVQEMVQTSSESSYETFEFTTPYGKTLPAPVLECAEIAIFMRAAFASWYQLPFYMSAWTPDGTAYFGHFGIRSKTGKYPGMPNFRTKYHDYTGMSQGDLTGTWPSDPSLRKRFLTIQKDDGQPFLGEGAYAGAYFDEIFLNKRTGHFLMFLLTYLGSIHLASPDNTFNLVSSEIRAGDLLLIRWQKKGIGHTYILKSVEELSSGQVEAELASGSMPRRQPKWQTAASSKYAFTKSHAGGPGLSSDNYAFAALGGGVKRWRTAKAVNGRYYNVVPLEDQGKYIASTDHLAISQRPEEFDEMLGELSPEAVTDVLVGLIEGYRAHLKQYPASCSARQKREDTFKELYDHLAVHGGGQSTPGPISGGGSSGWTREDVDRKYRTFEDYIFAPLVYDQSRTCCWNSTTTEMYEAIVAYATEHTYDETTGTCNTPPVFKMVNGGYEPFASYAQAKGIPWVAWSADETCPQSSVLDDTEQEHGWTAFCSIDEDLVDFQPEVTFPESDLEDPDESEWEDTSETDFEDSDESEWEDTSETEETVLNDGCSVSEAPGCDGCACEACVCEADSYCCGTAWDSLCVTACKDECGGSCP